MIAEPAYWVLVGTTEMSGCERYARAAMLRVKRKREALVAGYPLLCF